MFTTPPPFPSSFLYEHSRDRNDLIKTKWYPPHWAADLPIQYYCRAVLSYSSCTSSIIVTKNIFIITVTLTIPFCLHSTDARLFFVLNPPFDPKLTPTNPKPIYNSSATSDTHHSGQTVKTQHWSKLSTSVHNRLYICDAFLSYPLH